jgi:hypothetical protein
MRLSRDSLPVDLVHLANLYLGADSLERALDSAARGLALADAAGGPGPPAAANVFLATGQPLHALPLVAAAGVTRMIPGPTGGEPVPYGGAEPVIERLRALGATGAGGIPVRGEFERLRRIWSAPTYTPPMQRLLRRDAALRLAPALLLEPGALASWDKDLGMDEPLWRALVLSDTAPEAAATLLLQSIANPTASLSESTRAYLQATVAARMGDHRLAAGLYSRVDSLPLSLDRLDFGWGLRCLARLHRARSYEALGEPALALRDYEAFSKAWSGADSLGSRLVEDARDRARALRARR